MAFVWLIAVFVLHSVPVSQSGVVRALLVADHHVACQNATRPAIVNGTSTYVLSHDYDGFTKYPSNALCMWLLIAPPRKGIQLLFEEFSLQKSLECGADFVALYDISSFTVESWGLPMAKWCGREAPVEYVSKDSVYLVFRSDERIEMTGFAILYRLVDRPDEVKCDLDQLRCKNGYCVPAKAKCDHVDDCGDGTDEENCGFPPRKNLRCGIPTVTPLLLNAEDETYVLGGRNVRPDSWPWQASLRLKNNALGEHKCGATVVNERWLVSAAHCFRSWSDPADWLVYLGKTYLTTQELTEQTRYLDRVIVHPNYQMELFSMPVKNRRDHDLALLRLNAPLTLNDHVQPVCLAELPELHVGTVCYVTGWGRTEDNETSLILQQAAVAILSHEDCRKFYEGAIIVNQFMYCAGYNEGKIDACEGDSGGPLVAKFSTKWYLVGVVSGGLGCGAPQRPGIYTKIAAHHEWIQRTMSKNGHN